MHPKKQIEAGLKEFLNKEKISTYTIELLSDFSKGSNYTGEVSRLQINAIQYGEKVIYRLIAKIARKDIAFRTFCSVSDLYKHEIFMYRTVSSHFKKIQEENNIVEKISIPQLFGYSSEEPNETIILEDMTLKGFKSLSVQNSLDYKHAKLIIEELGRFHALSFAMRKYHPTVFEECCKHLFDVQFHGELGKTMELLMSLLFPECVKLFDSKEEEDKFNKVVKLQNTIFKNVQSKVTSEAAKPYLVVGHGDLWVSNMLFKYNDECEPIAACFVDYQFSKVYSPACDISQIMFACLDAHVRNKHYHDLMESYYKSFCLLLKKTGCDPYKLFPYHILQEHLKKFSIHGIITAVKMIRLVSVSSEVPDIIYLAENRVVATQMVLRSQTDPVLFNNRTKNVLLDFIKYGYDF